MDGPAWARVTAAPPPGELGPSRTSGLHIASSSVHAADEVWDDISPRVAARALPAPTSSAGCSSSLACAANAAAIATAAALSSTA